MICKDLAEYAARIIASSPLYLEVRHVYVVDSQQVKDVLKGSFNVLNPEFDFVIIPEWFPQVMVGTKSQTFSIRCSNIKGEQVVQMPEVLKLSKFNILIED